MSFDATRGTRGSRQPRGPVIRVMNALVARRIRRKGTGKTFGVSTLVLITIGRKSGVERSVPVGWFPGGDGSWLVVASANGALDNPAWYYNLAANPDKARIEVDGQAVAVSAEQLHGDAREQAWQTVVAAASRFAQYATKTDREIPVIRLSPRDK